MTYKLFLDDERHPAKDGWIVARSSAEAVALVESYGCPKEIAFDHDLGGADTAINFVDWLQDALLDGRVVLPFGFTYSVHSQNPIGAENIKGRLDGLLRHLAF